MIGGGMLLLLSGIWFIHSYHFPTYWSLAVKKVGIAQPVEVSEIDLSHAFRTISLPLYAFQQEVSFTAGPLSIHPNTIFIFLFFQIGAWSLFLTTCTRINTYTAYIGYFLFALMIHFSVLGQLLGSEAIWTNRGIEFGIILGFTGLAYLFQIKYITWHTGWRWLTFFVLLSTCYIGAYTIKGFVGLAEFIPTQFQYLSVISMIYLLYLAKEPAHLIVMFASNRKNKAHRLGLVVILISFALFTLAVLGLVQEKMAWSVIPLSGIPHLAFYALLIAALGTIFTSQNLYNNAPSFFQTRETYTFLLISLGVMLLSFFGCMFASGDYTFLSNVERLVAISLLTIGSAHMIYILANFAPLLREKILAFYLLGRGPKFGIMVAWILGLGFMTYLESSESWKSIRMFAHSYAVLLGDAERMADHPEEAVKAYRAATQSVPTSVKANYNLASLIVRDPNRSNEALTHYQQAIQYQDFPYARINAANLLYANYQIEEAIQLLEQDLPVNDIHPHLANNLGLLYREIGEPDSAILRYQQGLQQHPRIPEIYNNWANLYESFGRLTLAKDFYTAGLNFPQEFPALLNSAISFNLAHSDSIEVPFIDFEDPVLRYNQALQYFYQRKIEQAASLLRSIPEASLLPDALLLDGWLYLQQDSLDLGISRLQFLTQENSGLAERAHFLLGSYYFSKGVPEVARSYFNQAGEAGFPKGYLYAAKMAIDMGEADTAFRELTDIRGSHPDLWDDVSKELAMLLKAYSSGDETFAQTEWDLSTLTAEEQIRISLYADSLNGFGTALNHFRDILAADSSETRVYLEMGKIYDRYHSPMAEVVVKDGLAVVPEDEALNYFLARLYVAQGKLEEAKPILAQLAADSTKGEMGDWLAIEKALTDQDTALAIDLTQQLYQQQSLNTTIILNLADLYLAQDRIDEGFQLVSKAVKFNQFNPELWFTYAKFAEKFGMKEDAAYGAEQAIQYAKSENFSKEVTKAFGSLLKEYQ